jgi:lysophospholipase L1-like esterase
MPKRLTIALYGDSITQQSSNTDMCGWSARLQSRYQRHGDVLLRGYSGYNSAWAARYLGAADGELADAASFLNSVELATIFFGANDAAVNGSDGSQHLPLDAYEKALRELVALVRRHNPTVAIVLIAPPPVDEAVWGDECARKYGLATTNRLNSLVETYAARCVAVAASVGVPVLDTYTEMRAAAAAAAATSSSSSDSSAPAYRSYLSDGLHLSARGNEFVYESLMRLVRDHYRHLYLPLDDEKLDASSSSTPPPRRDGPEWRDCHALFD